MKVRVWTVAADDDLGTRATVHATEKAAFEQWLDLQSGSEDQETRGAAVAFIESGDFAGLLEWAEGADIGDVFDTYAVEEHEIDVTIRDRN